MTKPVFRLREPQRQRIVDHCLAELPNEGCGLFAMQGEHVVEIYPTRNLEASPTGFTVPPEEHHAALLHAESRGWRLGGVFHSHPDGTAEPSLVDVVTADEPEWVYLVVGLRDGPVLRAWRIRRREVEELPMSILEDR